MKWIPVSEQFPDDDTMVLVHVPDASEPVWIGFYVSEDDDWVWSEGATIVDTVTHWMPLPEPPK